MATLASNELNETEKKLSVITRQGKSILLILLLYIFIQNITNVHTYIHIYELFTRFVSVLRITAVTFVQMHCTTFPAYPSRCITQSWRNGRLYFTFTSPLLPWFHDCRWKRTISCSKSLYCCCFLYHFAVSELHDLLSTRLCIQRFHASHQLIVFKLQP